LLASTPNPSRPNQSVSLTATIVPVTPAFGVATGIVEFRENGTLLGSASLVNGMATLAVKFKKGTHAVTAHYAGDVNFTASAGSLSHQTN
jgi:hypothetical protein